jgi:hypothetical protein
METMLYKRYGNKRRTIPEDSNLLTPAKRACNNSKPNLTEFFWPVFISLCGV